LQHAPHYNDCREEAPDAPEEQADGKSAIYRHQTTAVKRRPLKLALVAKEIADEYNVPVRMSVEIFLDQRDREKLLGSFFVDLAIRGKIGLCCKVRPMKQVGRAASTTSLNGSPKRIDIHRRVQM
jgi:hypothetical protein